MRPMYAIAAIACARRGHQTAGCPEVGPYCLGCLHDGTRLDIAHRTRISSYSVIQANPAPATQEATT